MAHWKAPWHTMSPITHYEFHNTRKPHDTLGGPRVLQIHRSYIIYQEAPWYTGRPHDTPGALWCFRKPYNTTKPYMCHGTSGVPITYQEPLWHSKRSHSTPECPMIHLESLCISWQTRMSHDTLWTPWYTRRSHDTPWTPMIHQEAPWHTMNPHDTPGRPMTHHEPPWYTRRSHDTLGWMCVIIHQESHNIPESPMTHKETPWHKKAP